MFSLGAVRVFHGPNPWARVPVVAYQLRLHEGAEALIPRARERLAKTLPAFAAQMPADVPPRSSAEAVAQLVAFYARAALNEVRGFIDEAGTMPNGPGEALFWVGFHLPRITNSAIVLASRLVSQLLEAPEAYPSEELISGFAELQRVSRAMHPDYQARILMLAARRRDVPLLSFEPTMRMWQFGWGCRGRVFMETASDADSFVGGRLSRSKIASKAVFRDLGLPTPAAVTVSAPDELAAAAGAVGWPCVVKPLALGGGKGVTAGIRTQTQLEQAFAHARQFTTGPLMVEAFVEGHDYRLTVIGGKLAAATHRAPSSVIGDGSSTVRQLLERLNGTRSKNLVASAYLYPIALDSVLVEHLAAQGLAPDDVPALGRRVTLRSNANRSTGGVCFNVPDVHPEIRSMAETLAATFGLATAGIDYIASDIARPAAAAGGAFIEINTTPDMAVPVAGGMDEAEIGSLVLGTDPGRIPLVLVLADDPERDLAGIIGDAASGIDGLAFLCGGQAGLNGMTLSVSQMPPPERVRMLLKHRAARAAVVAWSVKDLLQFGAPVDRADLGVLYRTEITRVWRPVVESTCGRLVDVQDTATLLSAIRPVLAESPAQTSQTTGRPGA